MASPTQDLINRSVSVEGYVNPIAYDPQHSISYGYWICKQCTSSFFAGGEPIHKKMCSIRSETPGLFTYRNPNMIYVLGEKENGSFSPFKKEDIEKIKEFAKANIN